MEEKCSASPSKRWGISQAQFYKLPDSQLTRDERRQEKNSMHGHKENSSTKWPETNQWAFDQKVTLNLLSKSHAKAKAAPCLL